MSKAPSFTFRKHRDGSVTITAKSRKAGVDLRDFVMAQGVERERPCTCHPDDNPPVPCARKYALSECIASHLSTRGIQ